MTLDEARKVAAIASMADDGCPNCVKDMIPRLQKAFPEFAWKYDAERDYMDSIVVDPAPPIHPSGA